MRTRNLDKQQLVKRRAVEMLVKDGFQGFSMNRLAAACDISVATLYIYYDSKDDLIRSLGAEIGKQFMSTTLKDFSPQMSFADGLRKQWDNRSAFALKFPLEVGCFEIIRHSRHGDYVLAESLKEFKTTMGEFFKNAVDKKELIPVSVDVFWSVAYGPLYTLLRFHEEGKSIGGKAFKISKKTVDEAFQLVLKALSAKQ
jgi:TetR/AcrR family transcriptional regulator, multidrug resistance operon repressor